MLIQNFPISDPLVLQQAFNRIITGDIVSSSPQGSPCAIGYRLLSPILSLIWGTYSHVSGAWHTLGGIYITISIDKTPFFFNGKKIGLLEDPLEVTLTYNHQEIDFSFTHQYQSLVLYVDTEFFRKTYETLLQKPFDQENQPNLINFRDAHFKDSLLQELLPLSYQATHDNLDPRTGFEISQSLVEHLIEGLDFDSPNNLDRTSCQVLGMKAHEFLLARPRQRVSLCEISTELQAPLRSIQKGFQELYGLSPCEYHQNHRLFHLRNYIQRNGRENIGASGKLFGFHHAGRLSLLYKKTFGVLPSRDFGTDSASIISRRLGMTHLPSLG